MSKTIIVCLDGTWNGPGEKDGQGEATPSNVQKLFERLAGTQALQDDEYEAEVAYVSPDNQRQQVAKYIHGVGDSSNVLTKFSEGSTGAGLLARLARAYTFVSRNFCVGDDIIVVGFSRGAYTARALGGLIIGQGLLDWAKMGLGDNSDETAYAAAMTAWSTYRQQPKQQDHGFVARITDFVDAAKNSILSNIERDPTPIYRAGIPIKAIAVWDTVGALGLPEFVGDDGTRADLFQFCDDELSPAVQLGFHAIAADEERTDFTPTFWKARAGVTQTLFPGAHADVGGGYPASSGQTGLSDGALVWMLDKLSKNTDLTFKPYANIIPNPTAVAHQPWLEPIYRVRSQVPRTFPAGLNLNASIPKRIAAARVTLEGARDCPYQPQHLQPGYLNAAWQPHNNVTID